MQVTTAAGFSVGDRVRAKIDMLDDLRDDGWAFTSAPTRAKN